MRKVVNKMKYDCNKILDYQHEINRMCNNLCWQDCEFYKIHDCDEDAPISEITQDMIDKLQVWSDAHSEITILDEFKKNYPNAPLRDTDGTPKNVCPNILGYTDEISRCDGFTQCLKCWGRAKEEASK